MGVLLDSKFLEANEKSRSIATTKKSQLLLHIYIYRERDIPVLPASLGLEHILVLYRHVKACGYLLNICWRANAMWRWVGSRHNFKSSLTVETSFLLTLRWGQHLHVWIESTQYFESQIWLWRSSLCCDERKDVAIVWGQVSLHLYV